ncbi:E3 ubiquitin-protein ligase TRIM45-like [Ylistrum balloti]|uniref:E3 ubiquitin-protein ligase TRIM45-like n=1 Tax=Ylistrum balloti TaxID=509963 RepID=UPI002905F458|nr:E3 ubiquitin-protein ligase TRIM45-like [Ylistrum balloti]
MSDILMAFRKAVNKAKLNEEEQKHVRQCFICNEDFKDPRLLDCYHTFCFECIKEYIDVNSKGDKFKCPLCTTETNLPQKGPDEFEKNCFVGDLRAGDGKGGNEKQSCDVCYKARATSFCYECNQNYCQFCVSFHEKFQITQDHNVAGLDETGTRKVKRKVKCPTHEKNEIQYFCEQCKSLICVDCMMTTHKHHKSRDVVEVANEFRRDLALEINKEEYFQHLEALSDYSKNMKKKREANDGNEDRLMKSVEEQLEAFQNVLNDIKLDFISEISDTGMAIQNEAKDGRNTMERRFKSFAAIYFFSKLLLDQADDTAVVSHTVNLRKRLETLSADNTSRKKMESESGIAFEPGKLDKSILKELFGKLHDPSSEENEKSNDEKATEKPLLICKFECPPGDCVVSGIAPTDNDMAWVCMGAESVLHLFTLEGACKKTVSFSHVLDDVTYMSGRGYLTSNGAKMVRAVDANGRKSVYTKAEMCVRGIVADTTKNLLFVSCVENDVFFDGKLDDISSIISIEKNEGIASIPMSRDVPYPARLALNNNNIIISDWVAQAVIIQDNQGKTTACYQGDKDNEGKKTDFNPRGICVDENGYIYVVDIETDTIQMLDSTGKYQKDFLNKDDGLESPWSVACDAASRLWVGSQNGTIMIFNLSLTGTSGSSESDKTRSSTPDQRGLSGNKSRSDTSSKAGSRNGHSRGSTGSNESGK